MFAVNPPDDTLYSFSYLSEFTSLDGESPEKLKTEVDAAMEAVSNEMDKWDAFAGEALSNYLEKMALDKQEQDR